MTLRAWPRIRTGLVVAAIGLAGAAGILLLPHLAAAQGRFGLYDLPSADRYALDYRATSQPYAAVHDPAVAGEQIGSQEQDVRLTVPLARQEGERLWLGRISYRNVSLEYKGFDPALNKQLVPELYGTTLSVALLQRLKEDRSLLVFAATGSYSDDSVPSGAGTRTSGGAVYELRPDPRTLWGVGAATTYEFGAARLVPVLSYRYWGESVRANIRFPFYGDVLYVVSELIQVGGEFHVQGGDYAVSAANSPIDRVQYSSADLGAVLRVGRWQSLQGELSLGSVFNQTYRALENGHEVLDLMLQRGPYARLGVRYRF